MVVGQGVAVGQQNVKQAGLNFDNGLVRNFVQSLDQVTAREQHVRFGQLLRQMALVMDQRVGQDKIGVQLHKINRFNQGPGNLPHADNSNFRLHRILLLHNIRIDFSISYRFKKCNSCFK